MKQIYENIKDGTEVRANLIMLRQRLKEPGGTEEFARLSAENGQILVRLLQDADPKIRKNAALLIGDICAEHLLEPLYLAYEQEQTLFVRSAYLKAMENMDIRAYEKQLQTRLEEMRGQKIPEENQKHYREEISMLQKLVLKNQKHKPHEFISMGEPYDVVLTTNRKYREVTARQVRSKKVLLTAMGVKVEKADLSQLLQIRTFQELLFVLDTSLAEADPRAAAKTLAESNLLGLLKRAHGGEGEFYFRITIVGRMKLDKRSDYIKKCSFELEQLSGRKLINAPSDYEIEIRLTERRDGTFLPLLKLHTLKDRRFSYRKGVVAASIKPQTAALIAALTKPYLEKGAQVLDPFCGVGTMLIEREKAVEADTMYGIDIFGEAVIKARKNSALARKEIYYINRDFFDFTHEYLFDEIFTNMPTRGKKSREELEEFYQKFFQKAEHVLKPGGVMILYSNEKGYIKKQIRLRRRWKLINEYPLDEKEEFSVYIIGQRS